MQMPEEKNIKILDLTSDMMEKVALAEALKGISGIILGNDRSKKTAKELASTREFSLGLLFMADVFLSSPVIPVFIVDEKLRRSMSDVVHMLIDNFGKELGGRVQMQAKPK